MIGPYDRIRDVREKPGRTTRPGMSGKERTRLWIFALLFVFVLAALLGLRLWGASSEKPRDERSGDLESNLDIATSEDEEGRPVFVYQPPDPAEKRDVVRDEIQAKLAGFAETGVLREADPKDPEEILTWLLDQVLWNYRVTGVAPGLYQQIDEDRAAFEPAPWRGAFTSAFGIVREVREPVPFPEKVKGVENLYSAVFEAESGRLYDVVSASPIDREAGQWVQVYGVFYRLRPVELDGERKDALGLVLVKKAREAFPPRTVTEIDPAWAEEVREYSYDVANETDEPPFWLLLNYVRNLGIAGYDRMREQEGFRITEMLSTAKRLARNAPEYRFRYVAMQGRIVYPGPEVLQADNVGKIKRVDFAVLVQPEEYLVRLASPRPWAEYGFRMGEDLVRVEGIFYKRWAYVPRRGGEAREIPLVVVTGVYPDRTEPSEITRLATILVIVLAIGIVVAFFVLALRDRKGLNEFRQRHRDRQRAREAKTSAGSAEEE